MLLGAGRLADTDAVVDELGHDLGDGSERPAEVAGVLVEQAVRDERDAPGWGRRAVARRRAGSATRRWGAFGTSPIAAARGGARRPVAAPLWAGSRGLGLGDGGSRAPSVRARRLEPSSVRRGWVAAPILVDGDEEQAGGEQDEPK